MVVTKKVTTGIWRKGVLVDHDVVQKILEGSGLQQLFFFVAKLAQPRFEVGVVLRMVLSLLQEFLRQIDLAVDVLKRFSIGRFVH
jgi:hypothetical protein